MDFSAHAMRLDTYLSANNIHLDTAQLLAVDALIHSQLSALHLESLKKATHQLRGLLASMGHPIKQSFAFEALARYLGYQNWNCARSAAFLAPECPRVDTATPSCTLCFEILEKEVGVARLAEGLTQLPSLVQGPFRLRIVSRPLRDFSPINVWRTQNLAKQPVLQWIADSRRSWLANALRQNHPLFGLAKGVCGVRHFFVLELPTHTIPVTAEALGKLRDSIATTLGCRLAQAESRVLRGLSSIGPLPRGFKRWGAGAQEQLRFAEQATTLFDFECSAGSLTLLQYGASIEQATSQASPGGAEADLTLSSTTDFTATLGSCWLNEGVLPGKTQGIPLVSRTGNINVLDLWARHPEGRRASLFVISAMSGSGKSFLANDIVTDALSRRQNVRIVDWGRTYLRFSKMFGADYLALNPEAPVSLNLFGGVSDMSHLIAVLPLWAATLTELFGVQQIETTRLQQLLVSAWDEHREKLAVPALVTSMMSSSDIELVRLGAALQAFYIRNKAWLDGPSVVLSGAKRFIVVDTEDLTPDVSLATALRQLLLANLAQEAVTQSTGTLYLVDEGWYILKGMSRAFFNEVRRCMEAGGQLFGSILQSTNDADSLPFVQELLEHADYLLLMRQRRDSLEKLASGPSPFGRTLRRLGVTGAARPGQANSILDELCDVHSGKGFSEIALITRDQYMGVYRFATDRATYFTYTTNPRDLDAYKALVAQGHTPEQALCAQVSQEAAGLHG